MLEAIYRYLPISPTLATAGQPTADQFADIQQAGFAAVVNLALPTSDNALPDERSRVASLGLLYQAIPVVWEQPTLDDFQQFQQVMTAWSDRPVFVHCAANLRVSTFVYLHRRLSGVPAAEAATALHQIWTPNPIWQQFIQTVLEPSEIPHP